MIPDDDNAGRLQDGASRVTFSEAGSLGFGADAIHESETSLGRSR